ncbi:small-conductance mechanosensitive channel [Aquamicrobium defluvii]|uniref:Small-conductance mechanosensitive channel n=2 Tax=Aquamicrobium defluvii TaxID=69279 RepID=A0A4V3DL68_9HYPH|nr:small-conductance mechanosensitive channel [Aquamicrobium defluvii]
MYQRDQDQIMLLRIARYLLAVLIVLGAAACPVAAQDMAAAEAAQLLEEQRQALETLTTTLDGLEKDIVAHDDDDAYLVRLRLKLEAVSAESLQSALAFKPRLAEINTRLEQLGSPPADGQPPEAETIREEREALASEKAGINAVIATAQNLSLRSNKLIEQIAVIRRDLFRSMLTRRYPLAETFNGKVVSDAVSEFGKFSSAVSSWATFAYKFKFNAMVAATFMALIAALVLMFGGRRLVGGLFRADPAVEEPPYLTRLSVAFWSTLLPTAALFVFFAATWFFFNSSQVLRGDIGLYLRSAMLMVLGVFLVNRLTNAVLVPKLPQWRLVPVESRPARWLVRLATAMAVAVALNNFLSRVADQMSSPLSLTVTRSFIASLIVGVILILIGLVKPFRGGDGNWKPWPAWLRYSLFAIGALNITAALFGYIGFAIFVSLQVVMTGTILVTAYIGFLCAGAIGAEGGLGGSWLGRSMMARGYADESSMDQIGLGVSVLLNMLILLIFLPLTLFMWGFQPGDIQAWAQKLATGFSIGSVTISLIGILSGLFVFGIGYFLTRWFQGWLDGSVMARGKVDAGVRNSIRLAVGYAGIAVAALVGISAAGIDLSNLALVAGALSLGIGFGLQNVVSNFVSGLILLAERPFKVGDWIVAGDVSGTVRKISVRATEIETFQRQTVILPNSNLINGAVGNWTHRNKLGRVDIRVGVAYGTDVRRVQEILLEITRAHPAVLKNPEPFVQFANFGPAALEFEIRFFLADITNGGGVQNDIRFAIMDAFNREGIEIPSTARAEYKRSVLEPWPHDDDKTEAEFAERERLKAEEEEKARKGRRKPGKPDPA